MSLFIAMRSHANLYPFPLGFFTGKIEELQGLVHGIISSPPLKKVILYNGLIPASASGLIGHW